MFRSLTDEQLVYRHTGGLAYEWPSGVLSMFPTGDGISLRLRVECIPSRDPYPIILSDDQGVVDRIPVGTPIYPGEVHQWAPRPEFARPPVNPILTAYRDNPSAVLAVIITGEAEESDLDQYGDDTVDRALEWEPVELWADFYDHARKVLAKLAGVHA